MCCCLDCMVKLEKLLYFVFYPHYCSTLRIGWGIMVFTLYIHDSVMCVLYIVWNDIIAMYVHHAVRGHEPKMCLKTTSPWPQTSQNVVYVCNTPKRNEIFSSSQTAFFSHSILSFKKGSKREKKREDDGEFYLSANEMRIYTTIKSSE